ncbi:MAG: ATP-dependent zinc metalloprotease FtsH [Dehalococcoidia bacterium]|nr:MAG: ATP-dependent zinc metalloprotease FtsH [Dehalococcoidia bacterium]
MPNRKGLRNAFIYLLILVIAVAIFLPIFIRPESGSTVDIGTVLERAKKGEVATIEIQGDAVTATLTDGKTKLQSRKESSITMQQLLESEGVKIGNGQGQVKLLIREPSQFGEWVGLLVNFLPLLLFGGLLLFMMRQGQNAGNQAFAFGKSRARMFGGNRPTVTFADVAGVDEAKQELQEVVEFLKYPERFAALGARIPRGVLLVGPPGTGKTLLSRAVAGEAGVPFFSISGSEFVEMFVGVGASRVRDLFDQAKRNAPCIVFVDEIDAVGRQRGAGLGSSHDEREQTLNQILVEMDGFDTNTNVIVIAATNRPDILDPALLRPGRFDRQVVLDRPDINGRRQILEVHARGKPFDRTVNLEVIAKQTPGFSGADLANLLNEAAILAARRNKKLIGMDELEEAIDRVIAGPERKSRVITEREKEVTAYHEAGHAVVGHILPNADPVHKISIVSRGMMGGYTRFLPSEDRHLWSQSQFLDQLAVAFGGRAAEEIVFGEITTGAENDIKQATAIARSMVTEYGMSERLGTRTFGRREELVFLGRDINETRNYSEKTAEEIDEEVHALIMTAYHRAKDVIRQHRDKLDQIARVLDPARNDGRCNTGPDLQRACFQRNVTSAPRAGLRLGDVPRGRTLLFPTHSPPTGRASGPLFPAEGETNFVLRRR